MAGIFFNFNTSCTHFKVKGLIMLFAKVSKTKKDKKEKEKVEIINE